MNKTEIKEKLNFIIREIDERIKNAANENNLLNSDLLNDELAGLHYAKGIIEGQIEYIENMNRQKR